MPRIRPNRIHTVRSARAAQDQNTGVGVAFVRPCVLDLQALPAYTLPHGSGRGRFVQRFRHPRHMELIRAGPFAGERS